jgi:hypothetical protein
MDHADSTPVSHLSANSVQIRKHKEAQFRSDVVPQVGLDRRISVVCFLKLVYPPWNWFIG